MTDAEIVSRLADCPFGGERGAFAAGTLFGDITPAADVHALGVFAEKLRKRGSGVLAAFEWKKIIRRATSSIATERCQSVEAFAAAIRRRHWLRNVAAACLLGLCMAIVVSGVVFVRECGLMEDSRHLVQRLYPGGAFGATFPALALKAYPGMLVAGERCEVLFLNVPDVRRMMENGTYPRILSNLYMVACTQGSYAWRKLMLPSCYEIADRVLLYLKWRKEDGLSDPVKFKYGELAEYLGVNRTALYRAVAKLRKSGKIRIEDDTLALA